MKKYFLALCLTLIIMTSYSQVPTISSFSPISGSVGSSVVISGTNFNITPANNIVYFGATKASVTAASAISLTVTVPVGATYKPISVTTNSLTTFSRLPFVTSIVFCGGTLIDVAAWGAPVAFNYGGTTTDPGESFIADIDGDGNSEIVVLKRKGTITHDSVFIFRNTSSVGIINASSFAAPIGFSLGTNIYSTGPKLIIGDLDNDGKSDLVIPGNYNGVTSDFCILRNTSFPGSLSFATPQIIGLTNSGFLRNIAVGDLDGDGKSDLALSNGKLLGKRNTSTVGSISFTNDVIISAVGITSIAYMGDIDGDGKIDLVTDGSGSSDLNVKRNTSSVGSISMSSGVNLTNPFGADPTLLGDLDGDGKLDIITTAGMTYRNTSTSGFINASSFAASVKVITGGPSLLIVDLDRDGKPDLISGAGAYKNACTPGVIMATSFSTGAAISPSGILGGITAIGDLDGDNLPDYVHATYSGVNVVKSQPPSMSVAVSQLTPACGSYSNGSASAVGNYGTAPYTYTWSTNPIQNGQIATNLSANTYTVNVKDGNNCTANTVVTITQPSVVAKPAICMVTVDSLSNYNEIYWDKSLYTNIDSMIIWRETTSNTYKRIGAVDGSALSMYTDTARSIGPANGNPNIGTYRYKIQIKDTCGNYSLKSLWHNTVFFINSSGTFFWNEYKIEGDPIPIITTNPMTQFDLVRDDFAPTGNYNTVGSVAGTQTTLNDPFYVAFQSTADWRVFAYGLNCNVTQKPSASSGIQLQVVKSKSNIKHNFTTTDVKQLNNSSLKVMLYPNPTNNSITIELPELKDEVIIEIQNMLGELVYSLKGRFTKQIIDMSKFQNGIYSFRLSSSESHYLNKIVVQK